VLLICIMIGATLTHLLVIGGSPVPALFCLALSAAVVYAERGQFAGALQSLLAAAMIASRRANCSITAVGLAPAFVVPLIVTLLRDRNPLVAVRNRQAKAAPARRHRLVLPINTDDPTTMRALISTSLNIPKYFKERNEPVTIEVVAYNAGVHMLAPTPSPVKESATCGERNDSTHPLRCLRRTKLRLERSEGIRSL